MAKVIPVGPINPELYAFAKKQAERAERTPGYVPKKVETPAHSIIYRRIGETVKAFVIDKIAPITFSSFGSALPVSPSFLHLHSQLPEKISGRANTSAASGQTKDWGRVDFHNKNNDIGNAPFSGTFKELAQATASSVALATSARTMFDAAKMLWNIEYGAFPDESLKFSQWGWNDSGGVTNENSSGGAMSVTRTYLHAYASAEASCQYEDKAAVLSLYTDGMGWYPKDTYYSAKYRIAYSYMAYGVFLDRDIRLANPDFTSSMVERSAQCALCNINSLYTIESNALESSVVRDTALQESNSANIAAGNSVVAFDGGVLFPVLDVGARWEVNSEVQSDGVNSTASGTTRKTVDISTGVAKNLGVERVASRIILRESTTHEVTPESQYPGLDASANAVIDKHVFVAGSIADFDGIFIWASIYSKWPGGTKTQYAADSPLVNSGLTHYFDISQGEYRLSDAPHLEPPAITTDGICLPHAWFFYRENEALQGMLNANSRNHISVVVYPQDRHGFSADEAEIFSVELKHPPRFVARPGGAIEIVMRAANGASPLVPYVVHGLVKEVDASGRPTDLYLAADGSVSGTFEPSDAANRAAATFKLSPRQRLDANRLIFVETTTEREHGVQAHIEVLGAGDRVPPGPPSLTLECTESSVLAGQASTFYVTVSHAANGSQVAYEILRADEVIASGHVQITSGAGSFAYVAPLRSLPTVGSPTRYVLADPLDPSTTPSIRDFEVRLVHDGAPEAVTFGVMYSHESYANSSSRPEQLPSPPLFYLDASVLHQGADEFVSVRVQQPLAERIWCSLKSKRVYVTFWDGQSCEVSNILKKTPNSELYEFNPDWREEPFDYPPAADPYSIKGTLEPYVYAYEEYENNRRGA